MSGEFKLKKWAVDVIGHGTVYFDAATRGKAQARAFEAYRATYDACTFRDFLQRSTVRRSRVLPEHYGDPILVDGEPAFFVGYSGSNSLRFVRPDEDKIMTSHLLDTTVPWRTTDANLSE